MFTSCGLSLLQGDCADGTGALVVLRDTKPRQVLATRQHRNHALGRWHRKTNASSDSSRALVAK